MKQTYKNGLKAVLLCLATVSLLTACGKDADGFLPDVSVKELTVTTHVNGYLPEGAEANSRASNSGNAFNFTSGDAIGLIGLKNGSVVTEYNNVKLTYSGNGNWGSGEPMYDSGATSYIAYYPYRSDMSGKTSVDAIKSAFPIKDDQSLEADFNASNLLTATATPNGENLKFNFTPAFAMVEVTVPDEIKGYSNANKEDYTYKIHGGTGSPVFTLKSYKISDKTYRRIIKSSTPTEIKVTYTVGNGYTLATYTKSVNISAGYYKKLALQGTIKRDLQVGDYIYYSNGNLVFIPNKISPGSVGHGSDILGLFFYSGTTTADVTFVHGVAVALKEASTSVNFMNAPAAAQGYTPSAPSSVTTGWYLPNYSEALFLLAPERRPILNNCIGNLSGATALKAEKYWQSNNFFVGLENMYANCVLSSTGKTEKVKKSDLLAARAVFRF